MPGPSPPPGHDGGEHPTLGEGMIHRGKPSLLEVILWRFLFPLPTLSLSSKMPAFPDPAPSSAAALGSSCVAVAPAAVKPTSGTPRARRWSTGTAKP